MTASHGFQDNNSIAGAVMKKLKSAIDERRGTAAPRPRRRPAATDGGRGARRARLPGCPRPPVPEELRRRPVGVFDSGVGGLTVLHELLVRLPHEDFVYLADDARFPFGTAAAEELEAFSLEIAEELLARRAKLLVVACNSATAAALPALRARMLETTLGVDVLGVVQPAAVQAVAATHSGRVGLLATPTTVASGAYAKAIAEIDPFVALTSVAAAGADRDRPGGLAVRRARRRGRARLLRAADRGGRRHGDPRLDALPARGAGAPAMLGRGWRRSPRAARSRARSSTCSASRARAPARRPPGPPAQGEYRFLCTGDVERFRALGTRFLQMPLGEVARVWSAGSPDAVGGGRAHRRERR